MQSGSRPPAKTFTNWSMKFFSGNINQDRFQISDNGQINSIIANQAAIKRSISHKAVSPTDFIPYMPRDTMDVPVMMAGEVKDKLLFEAAKNPAEKYYLPKYKIAVQKVSGKEQFRIRLAPAATGSGGALTVYFESYAAAELADQVSSISEMPHQVKILLKYQIKSNNMGSIPKTLLFQEISESNSGIKAVLKIKDLQELTQVYKALTDSDFEAQLLVERAINTAIPLQVPIPLDQLNPRNNRPILVFTKIETHGVFQRIHFGVRNRHLFPDELFKSAPDLPSAGYNKQASRTWVTLNTINKEKIYGFCALSKSADLADLWIAYPKSEPFDTQMYLELEDRKTNKKYQSELFSFNRTGISTVSPSFKPISTTLEETVDFNFPENLHGYIYRGVSSTPNDTGGYISRPIQWEGIGHIYLQDEVRMNKFLYLPDEFRLARIDGEVRLPWFRVEFLGDSLENLQAKVSYRLKKYIDYERILDASIKLKEFVEDFPEEGLLFEPLMLGKEALTYELNLLNSSAPTTVTSALLSINHIDDILPLMSIDDFSSLFNVLLDASQVGQTLRGALTVKIANLSIPPIPVSIRFGEIGNELFKLTQTYQASNKKIILTLENSIESRITAEGLIVKFPTKTGMELVTVDPTKFPIDLATGDVVSFEVTVPSSISVTSKPEIVLDWQTLKLHPDGEKIYDTVIDDTIKTSYQEPITVKESADAFVENSPIRAIQVSFKNSETGGVVAQANLDAAHPEKEIIHYFPIRDTVLNLPTEGTYWYQVRSISTEKIEGAWKKSSDKILYLTSDEISLPSEITEDIENIDLEEADINPEENGTK